MEDEAGKRRGPPEALQRSPAATPTARHRCPTLIWLAALTSIYLVQSLPGLTRVPRVIMDESWEACTGYALAYQGRLRNPVIQDRAGIDRAFVQPRVVQSLILAASYKLLGFSLASGRLASVLVGLVAVWGTFYLARTWLTVHAAGLTALLLTVETQFFILSRTIRPEVYLAGASVWMMAVLARAVLSSSPALCFLAGLIGAIGCYTHPNMVIFAALGVLLIFCHGGLRRWTAVAVAFFGLGGVLGLAPFLGWVGYAQGRYEVRFVEQLGNWYAARPHDSVTVTLLREMRRWVNYFQLPHRALWLLMVVLGVMAALRRRQTVQLWALAVIGGHALLLPVLNRKGSPHYLVVLSPWLAMVVVVGVVQLWQWAANRRAPLRRSLRTVGAAAVGLSLAVQLAGNLYVFHAYRGADYEGVCQRIAQSIPPGARVYGNLVYWTGLHRYPYLSEVNEEMNRPIDFMATIQARLIKFRPQYAIRSSDLCWTLGGLGPRPTQPTYQLGDLIDVWRITRDSVDQKFLAQRGVLLDQFTTRDFGAIEVYAIRP